VVTLKRCTKYAGDVARLLFQPTQLLVKSTRLMYPALAGLDTALPISKLLAVWNWLDVTSYQVGSLMVAGIR